MDKIFLGKSEEWDVSQTKKVEEAKNNEKVNTDDYTGSLDYDEQKRSLSIRSGTMTESISNKDIHMSILDSRIAERTFGSYVQKLRTPAFESSFLATEEVEVYLETQ